MASVPSAGRTGNRWARRSASIVQDYRYGRSYWTELAQRLSIVALFGQLGKVEISGEGPNAVATLTPSDPLVTVYQGLAAKIEERKADELAARAARKRTYRKRNNTSST